MYDLTAIRDAYLSAPEEAVFLERATILHETKRKYRRLPSGLRQARILADLCEGISVVVNPADVLLGRLCEVVPTAEQEEFVGEHPELFIQPGVPGWLESASIYIPDWHHLLNVGISGLIEEVKAAREALNATTADTDSRADELDGIRLSLLAVSRLIERYAAEARLVAARLPDRRASKVLLRAAQCCETVATGAPRSLQEALQLFIIFHMVLSCIIGGRNVTPGRMDQYLQSFYERDIAGGTISREEAVELLAVTMIMLSQLSGSVATDFQSKKRTPNRFSHYYVTIGGLKPDGESAVNDLSLAFLEARRLVEFRDPSLSVRHFPGIERVFWRKAVEFMRDALPVFAYNDTTVIAGLTSHGIPECVARGYAHCGCMICFLPGQDMPPLRANHNGPVAVLLAMNAGVDPVSGKRVGEPTQPPDELNDFEDLFAAFRRQLRRSLRQACQQYTDGHPGRAGTYPLLTRCLLRGHLAGSPARRYADQYLVGVATTIDSLLAIRHAVYQQKMLTLPELAKILQDDFVGHEVLRAYLMNRVPSYGSDDAEVIEIIERVSRAWVEEVRQAGSAVGTVSLRPAFFSWLFNIELGKRTGATPDGRRLREPLSSDQTPSQGKSRGPTQVLRAIAHLAHECTCSGGTTFRLSPSHFKGEAGLDRLSALIEGYFAEKGLQLHFIFADSSTLREAVRNPEKHRDLLVRVAGFTEYFVRLLPEVQQEIIQRAEYDGAP